MQNLKVTIRHGEGDNATTKTVTLPNHVVDTIKEQYGQDVNVQRIELQKHSKLKKITRHRRKNISARLRELGKKNGLPDTTRQILQNEFEATALYWFLQAGGNAEDFEKVFNE